MDLQDQNTFSDGASMYDSLNSGSVAAIMDDEPVIKYAIKQGREFKTPYQKNSKWSAKLPLKGRKSRIDWRQ